MAWQDGAPTLPSGSKWVNLGSANVNANKYAIAVSIAAARLADNVMAVRFVVGTSSGSTGVYYPPGYLDFKVGNSTSSPGWSAMTRTWTGTLAKGSKYNAAAGAHDSGGSAFTHATYLSAQVTGLDYVSKYTITYNGNGNTGGSTASKSATYATPTAVSNNGYTKTGHQFSSWNTKADGSGTSYSPGGSITITGNTTLYAQWVYVDHTITYKSNGSGESDLTQTKSHGVTATLKGASAFTRQNYTLLHWNTAADDSGTGYALGGSYSAEANLTLYAIWKKNNIPLYVSVDGNIKQVEKAFTSVNGQIKECVVYTSVNGSIKELT